jgi:VWFA-related protein
VHSRLAFICILIIWGCLSVTAQSSSAAEKSVPTAKPAESTPTFRAVSRLVLLDAVVTGKHGEFIRDLKPADFTVLEDGKLEKISGFSAHLSTSQAPVENLQLPPNVYTNYTAPEPGHPITIVLLDMLNTERLERSYARQQMLKFLSSIPPGQPIALFALASKLEMLQGFTQSSDSLIAAAKHIIDNDVNAHLQTSAQDLSDAAAMDAILDAAAGRVPVTPASILDSLGDENNSQTDIRVRSTLLSLQALATMVAGYSGRKNLIWLSADFPIIFGPGFDLAFVSAPGSRHAVNANSYVDELHKTSAVLASSQIAVYPISVRGLQTSAPGASNMGGPPNSSSRALQTFSRWNTQYTMDDIARETGGEAFYNQNDLRKLMQRSLDEGTNYYTLAYVPQDHNWDGRYRKIEIKVSVEGAKIRYRSGYYAAPDVATNQTDAAHLLAAAMQPAVPESTSLLFKVKVVPPQAQGQTVSIDFAVSPSNLSFADGPDGRKDTTVDFMAVALDRSLKEAGLATNTVAASMRPDTYQQVIKTGFPGHLDLNLKPGNYVLRLGVIDRNTGKIGTLDVPLKVMVETTQK